MSTHIDVHRVTRIVAEPVEFPQEGSTRHAIRLHFHTADGQCTRVMSFTGEQVIAIEGADHLAHIASGEKEPA